MSVVRRALAALAVAALLAGCGRGSSSVTPPLSPQGGDRGTEAVTSTPPTLYVSGKGTVYAYNLTDAGNTAPRSALGTFYNAADNTAIAAIAADRKGTLDVLVNYGTAAEGPGSPSCYVQTFPFTAHTGDAPTLQYQCGSGVYSGDSIQTGPNGEVDVLDTVDPSGNTGYQVERFFPTSGSTRTTQVLRLTQGQPYVGIAAGAAGNLIALSGTSSVILQKFAPLVVGNTAATVMGTDPSISPFTAVAAGRGNVVVSGRDIDFNEYVNFYDHSLQLASQLGPFAFTDVITAVAIDQDGNLYVGITRSSGTAIEVFPPGATDATSPARVLNNPVRRGNPAGAVLTGIAIAQ